MQTATAPRYRYHADPHPVFRVPPTSTPIWRYMTLPKLLAMLDSGRLFFCRVSKFPDRFEGAIPRHLDSTLREWERQYMGPDAGEKTRAERVRTREIVVASCWHMSRHESSAMWSQFGKGGEEGVAIRSTVDSLIGALPQRESRQDIQGWEEIFLGQIEYIDYSTATFPPHNVYYPYVHKREDYRHENEVRALTMISEDAIRAVEAGLKTEFEITQGGLAIPVKMPSLLEAVHVSPFAPSWFEHVVRTSLERFGFGSTPVLKSAMAEDPVY